MFNENEYSEPEKFEILRVNHGKCSFEGNLYERKDGGFDLFLFRDNSEFECLEIEKITWLRRQAPDGSLLVERFGDAAFGRELKKKVEAAFVKWLEANLGLQFGGKHKCLWQDD